MSNDIPVTLSLGDDYWYRLWKGPFLYAEVIGDETLLISGGQIVGKFPKRLAQGDTLSVTISSPDVSLRINGMTPEEWAVHRDTPEMQGAGPHAGVTRGDHLNQTPPDDDICRECYEWRLDGPHGYRWFRTCEPPCRCPNYHNEGEAWIG